ncbi:MAG TPA: cytochrome c3 family protein [Gemmata sp.]
MRQIFPEWFDTAARAGLVGAALLVPAVAVGLGAFYRSDYVTGAHAARRQPVPFSHAHHVGQLGIDCRYCHPSAERSPFAGMPATETCMNCHEQLWVGAPLLEPVRRSWRAGAPLRWQRVHNLPGYVYFDHSAHVGKGVGCAECHGRVDEMPLTWQEEPLTMGWCLDCHRNPAPHLRPRDEIYNPTWTRPPAAPSGTQLAAEYRVRDAHALTSCSTCHR